VNDVSSITATRLLSSADALCYAGQRQAAYTTSSGSSSPAKTAVTAARCAPITPNCYPLDMDKYSNSLSLKRRFHRAKRQFTMVVNKCIYLTLCPIKTSLHQ
jgi:hypothetical protein